MFWLLALVLFYLPSAAVVIYLNRLMPLEGGLYQWAKLGFNETVGFMLAWNLWLYVIVFTSEIGLQCATYLSYAIGPSAAWMTTQQLVRGAGVGGAPVADGGHVDDRPVGRQVGAQHRRRLHAHRSSARWCCCRSSACSPARSPSTIPSARTCPSSRSTT